MANEIYDSTWWGNTIDTASSIGTSTEMIQGQFNLTKIGDELVTNGDFSNGLSSWSANSSVSLVDGKAKADGTASDWTKLIQQQIAISTSKSYRVSMDISPSNGGVYVVLGGTVIYQTSSAIVEDLHIDTVITPISIYELAVQQRPNFNGSIDNVSVKEVRATTVEAVKCLADTIHRIGLQDIQN